MNVSQVHGSPQRPAWRTWMSVVSTVVLTFGVLGVMGTSPASASSVTSATFTGGTGTASAGGTLYARSGAALTLNVVASSDTKCVAVTGAGTLSRQTSSTAKTNWTFTTTAPAGDGAQAFTVAASPNFNANGPEIPVPPRRPTPSTTPARL